MNRFTTHFFNTNQISNIETQDVNELYNKFINYIGENKFDYSSKSEKLLEDLKVIAEKEEMRDDVLNLILQLDQEYEDEKMVELEKYKSEIIYLIEEELAARIDGRSGRILQALKHDKQFDIAVELFGDEAVYNNILGITN